MSSVTLIDATDLVAWANRRDAQARLPQLVRRLLVTTASGIARLQFRSGEGVVLPGYDGLAEVKIGSAFVPDDLSVWEMGTDRNAGAKAQADYDKRSADPMGVDPAEAAFVFVTPRRWAGKERWAAERTKDGRWREVRAYDADDLEAWLELSPAVHAWISAILGKASAAIQDLETYWATWAHATSPPLPAGLLRAGRDETVAVVLDQLAGDPGALAVRADSRVEALAFLAASVHQLPDAERDAVLARAVVVGESAWRWVLARTEQPLLLVPLFEGADATQAVEAGHHVLIPLGREAVPSARTVELPRLRRQDAQDALQATGMPEERAAKGSPRSKLDMFSGVS